MSFIGITGFITYKNNGFPVRLKEKEEYSNFFENSLPGRKYHMKMKISERYREDCNFYDLEQYYAGKATRIPTQKISESCYKRNLKFSKSLLLWGDSHAQQLSFGLRESLPADWQVLQVASSSCKPSIKQLHPSNKDYCVHSNWFALETIRNAKPDVVLIAQHNGHDLKSFKEIVDVLNKMQGKKIVVAGPTPEWTKDLPKIILRKLWSNTPERTQIGNKQDRFKENDNLKKNFQLGSNVYYANLLELLCNKQGCLTFFKDRKEGISTWDYGHLTPLASKYVADNLLTKVITSDIKE